ncbi:MAG: DUF11 domain-containing protein, partial [Gammaproteobacteria bacterium]|nr:DUF11 domain-containing protein [Gammaproteobacteria bacterium]
DPVDNVIVTFRTPLGISFDEENNAAPNANLASCGGTSTGGDQPVCTAGEEAYWSLGTLAAGGSRTIQLSTAVNAGLVDGMLITVPVIISGTGADAVSLERTVQVNNTPVLQMALAASTDPVQPGEIYTYQVDVGNPTQIDQSEVVLRLSLPAGVTVGNISDGGTQDATTGDILWDIANLSAGGVVHREVDVTVAADAADGTILSARVEARLAGGLEVDASSEQTVTVDSTIALAGEIGASPNPVSAGGQLDYEITVSNVSAAPVDTVRVTFRTPVGISFHEEDNAAPDADSGSCGGSTNSAIYFQCTAGEEAYWTLGTLAAGESRTIQLSAAVGATVVDGTLITVPVIISGTGADAVSLERTVPVN